jgi:predicted nucleic-acid-binding Zn-ribbon protein
MHMADKECPKCGNPKHQEVISIETEGDSSKITTCKACGHKEIGLEFKDEKQAVEHMGDAFREYLNGKKKKDKKAGK